MGSWTPSEPYQRGATDPRERSPTRQDGDARDDQPTHASRAAGDLPKVLRVERWAVMEQANAERVCFPAAHRYVEILWTTRLGPMSVILLRRLADAASSEQVEVDVAELAVAIGAPGADRGVGKRSPLERAMQRLVRFRFAGWMPDGGLAVVTWVPALGERDLARLPGGLRDLHQRLVDELRDGL